MRGRDLFNWLRKMAVDEGAVTIAPHREPFANYQRTFLDGLRKIPATIEAPPGVNPYSVAMGKPGAWLMIWVPDEK